MGDTLFVHETDSLYDVDLPTPTTPAVTGARLFRPTSPGFNAFHVDLAYDGNWWGVVGDQCLQSGQRQWGRIDPSALSDGTNQPGVICGGRPPYDPEADGGYANNPPVFIREVPEPGAPIGYRIAGAPPPNAPIPALTAGRYGQSGLDVYAVDSLSPYTEHLLAAGTHPARFNFGLGTAVRVAPGAGSQESRTNVFTLTTDGVYCFGPGPLCPGTQLTGKVQQTGFLSLYSISRNAVISGSRDRDLEYILDGGELLGFSFSTADVSATFVPPLSQMVGASYYGCVRGGVHFSPDTRILTSEAGGTWAFTATLTHPPTADVILSLASSDTAEGTVSPGVVTFTPANWNVPQTITVTGVSDSVVDGPKDYVVITGDLVSGDANYSSMVIRDLAATNHEDNGPSLTVHTINAQPGATFTAHVADVADVEDPAGALDVHFGPNRQLILGSLQNANGTVTAPLSAPCGMGSGYSLFWPIEVADSAGNKRTGRVEAIIGAQTAPSLAYPASTTVTSGSTSVIAPSSYPLDQSVASMTVIAPTFGGTITADSVTGALTVSNAGPAGNHPIEVTAAHRCDPTLTTTTSFDIHVNEAPALTAGAPVVLQQGTAATLVTLGTVNDLETAAGSLTVSAPSVPSGITVGAITNSGGTITALLSASCSASTGVNTITLRVTDADGASAESDFTIDVTANAPPTIGAYGSIALNEGSSMTATPAAAPADNVAVSSVTVSAPGFAGTLSVDLVSGVVTIANASPAGDYSVTVTVADDCGATTTTSFPLSVNALPSIAGGSGSLDQGTTLTVTLATVSDTETAAGSLSVITTRVPPGITVGPLANSGGTIMAQVTVACGTPAGVYEVGLQVSDGLASTDGAAMITVAPGNASTLGTYAATNVLPGSAITVAPSVAFVNSGSTSFDVSASGFTGGLTVSSTGIVSITDAAPAGQHVVTVTATDACEVITRTFTLTVNTPPSITPQSSSIAQGDTQTLTLATISDADETAGSLTVVATSASPGLTIGPLTNTNGSITAVVTATCSASTGNVSLQVTDNLGVATTAPVTIEVVTNSPPAIGAYSAIALNAGDASTVTPSAAPSDDRSVSVSVAAPGFAGTLSVDAGSGVVAIANAAPRGIYTVTVTVTDDCGATATSSFALSVNGLPAIAPRSLSIRQGQSQPFTLATVSDPDGSPESLSVIATDAPFGVTIDALTNARGTITARLSASCASVSGMIGLRVTDAQGASSDANVPLNVTPNPSPVLGTYSDVRMSVGSTTTVSPTAPLEHDGPVDLDVTASPLFPGELTVDARGVVSITANASGTWLIIVTASNDCGATERRTFTLTVPNSRRRAVRQ